MGDLGLSVKLTSVCCVYFSHCCTSKPKELCAALVELFAFCSPTVNDKLSLPGEEGNWYIETKESSIVNNVFWGFVLACTQKSAENVLSHGDLAGDRQKDHRTHHP